MSEQMTDLEITRACAEAMGWRAWQSKHGYWNVTSPEGEDSVVCDWNKYDAQTGEKLREPTIYDALAECDYKPLHDKAQAMDLVIKLNLDLSCKTDKGPYGVWAEHGGYVAIGDDLLRCICLCVAKMHREQA